MTFRTIDRSQNITSHGRTQADGTFELTTFSAGDGAVPGMHRAIVAMPVIRDERTGVRLANAPPPIAAKYAKFETSGLEFNVIASPAKNQFSIEVTPAVGANRL